MLTTGTIVANKYRITGMVGRGGMSYVYSATNIENNRKLAIKEAIRTGVQGDRLMERSLNTEGYLLKNLNNPHLPRIYDIIEDASGFMIVMDYVEGISLNKIVEGGAMPVEQVIDIAVQVCDVFHYLHTQNPPIIYRDMKPANLILRQDGFIMMTDFGTARTWKGDAYITSDTILIGTEGFAAPEQFGGYGESDARTDIFCLGATMYNMVTGHSPYVKPVGIQPLGNFNPSLAGSPIEKIIRKCTANDPAERFQSALELRETLEVARKGGKTGLLPSIFGKVIQKDNQGWQNPVMQVADGRSQMLPPKKTESDYLNQSGNPKEGSKPISKPLSGSLSKPVSKPLKGMEVNQSNNGFIRQSFADGPETDILDGETSVLIGETTLLAGETTLLSGETTLLDENKRRKITGEEPMADNLPKKLKLLTMVSLIAALVFLMLGIVMMLIKADTVAIVMIVIAIGAVILGVIGAVLYLSNN